MPGNNSSKGDSLADRLREQAKKGKFGKNLSTQNNNINLDESIAVSNQQDLLTAILNRTERKQKGSLSLPSLYGLKGKQVNYYAEALKSLGVNVQLNPDDTYFIDQTGFCPALCFDSATKNLIRNSDYLGNKFIIVSADQVNNSIVNSRYSFMKKLIEEFEKYFSDTTVSFTRGESVLGQINNVIIDNGIEVFLKEEKYRNQQAINVTANISTPSNSIDKLRYLNAGIADIRKNPDTITIESLMAQYLIVAQDLKVRHKKLTDLIVPKSNTLYHPVTGFGYAGVEQGSQLELYYLNIKKPIFIIFGAGASAEDYVTSDFIMLSGDKKDRVINNLLDLSLVDYLTEYVERLRDAKSPKNTSILSAFGALTGKSQTNLSKEWNELNDVATTLRLSDVSSVAAKIRPDYQILGDTRDLVNMKGQYIRSLSPELKYAIIFPKSDVEDTILCDLITRCGPSQTLNLYRSTEKFIPYFLGLNEANKIETLKKIDEEMRFKNQNNFLVNTWLAKYHADICKSANIGFSQVE